eukprot:5846145-Prymnesium_polylepis.1
MMNDVVERMAAATSRSIVWKGLSSKTRRRTRFSFGGRRITRGHIDRRTSINVEALTERSLNWLANTHSSEKSANMNGRTSVTGQSSSNLLLKTGAQARRQFSMLARKMHGSRSEEEEEVQVINHGSTVFVCCSRRDAVMYARVLRSELATYLGKACAVGGGTMTADLIPGSGAFVLLLTRQILTDADALFEIWTALQLGLPLITIVVTGAYDFAEASSTLSDLSAGMERAKSGTEISKLRARLPDDTDVDCIGRLIQSSISAMIAISWAP